eukprot:8931523-Pyramimonas_sp.AAC.1
MTEASLCRRRQQICPPWSARGADKDLRDIGHCARMWHACTDSCRHWREGMLDTTMLVSERTQHGQPCLPSTQHYTACPAYRTH